MATVPYDNFLAEVLPDCPGAPDEAAINAIRNAAIEFCDESLWYQYTPGAVVGVPGVATYALSTPAGTLLQRVTMAWYEGTVLFAKSADQLNALSGTEWRTLQGTPQYYTQSDDATVIVLVPFPLIASTIGLTSLVALRPSRVSTTIDSDVYEKWAEVIAFGAKARLQGAAGQSYTNVAASERNAMKFRLGIAKARMERNRGLVRGDLVMRPPRFV